LLTWVVSHPENFTRQFFEGRHQHGVQDLSQIDVVVLFGVWEFDLVTLHPEKRLDELDAEVFTKRVKVFLFVILFTVVGLFVDLRRTRFDW